MRYNTKKLWKIVNHGSIPAFERAVKEWRQNDVLYRRQLDRILPQLKPSARTFFNKIGLLHDGTLLRFEAGDAIDFSISQNVLPRDLQVRIFVEASDLSVFVINYEKVTQILFDFPTDMPLFDCNRIGDWGYDELTLPSAKVFSHEVIFSSGAAILIKSRQITVKRLPPKR